MTLENKLFNGHPRTCEVCDTPLKLGKFAYEQKMCWPCFVQRTTLIMLTLYQNCPTDQLKIADRHVKQIEWMLGVVAEAFGKKR